MNGVWYLYPAAIYPFPDYVANDAFDGDPGEAVDDGGGPADNSGYADTGPSDDRLSNDDTGGGAIAPTAAMPGQPPAAYWYFCDATKTYYPYVQTCTGGWRQVAAPSQ